MSSRSVVATQSHTSRKAREQHNHQQAILRLPAELRNAIWDLIISSREYVLQYRLFACEEDWKHPSQCSDLNRSRKSYGYFWFRNNKIYQRCDIPGLFHVCRRIRAEIVPMFFANAIAVLHVRVPNLSKTTFGNTDSFLDVFSHNAIASLRRIEIRSDYICPDPSHGAGYAGPRRFRAQDSIKVLIDRRTETVEVTSLSSGTDQGRQQYPCCRKVASQTAEELVLGVRTLKLQQGSRKLKKEDLERLETGPGRSLWRKAWSKLITSNARKASDTIEGG